MFAEYIFILVLLMQESLITADTGPFKKGPGILQLYILYKCILRSIEWARCRLQLEWNEDMP